MLKHYALIGLILACAACNKTADQTVSSSPPQKNTASHNELYELMLAEVAYQRGDYKTALAHYHNTTITSHDKKLASHTTHLALELNQPQMALKPAIIWADQAPNNPRPQALVVLILIPSEQYLQALPYLSRLTQDKKATPYLELITQESTPIEKTRLITLFKRVYQKQQFSAEAGLLVAKFIYPNQPMLAKQILTQVLKMRPGWHKALSFKSKISAN